MNEKYKTLPIIQCPVCSQQYLLGEVYMPNSFFGNQKDIIKDDTGKIDFYLGDDPDLSEEYICDNCGSKLKINANITFDVEISTEENFDEDFTVTIDKNPKIKLEEESLF